MLGHFTRGHDLFWEANRSRCELEGTDNAQD